MARTARTLLPAIAAVILTQAISEESDTLWTFTGIVSGSDQANESSPVYNIYTEETSSGGRCIRRIHVAGKGIIDAFTAPCDKDTKHLVTSGEMTYGKLGADSVALYSNTPYTMFTVTNGVCMKKTYPTGRSLKLTYRQCTRLKDNIAGNINTIGLPNFQ